MSHYSADVGGASFTYNNVTLVFNGNNNSANRYGGAILASGSLVLTFTIMNFFNNSVEHFF